MNGSRNNEYITAFGNNLRALRKSKGLSMEKLAQEAGVEYSQISDIELGKINTTISTVHLLSNALGVPTKDLFEFNF